VAAKLPGLLEGSALSAPVQTAADELAPFLSVMRAALAPQRSSPMAASHTRSGPGGRLRAEFRGEIHNRQGVKSAEFRAAYSDGSGVPRRMEYHPKSFLRPVLEAEPPEESPLPVPSLSPQEAI